MKPLLSLSFLFIVFISNILYGQNSLDYYINAAIKNDPLIKENQHNINLRKLDRSLNDAQNNLPQISFTANYVFAPYFNNKELVTPNPDSLAVGYDPSITNGGLYSAQINVTKNLFNGGISDANEVQTNLQIKNSENTIMAARHSLEKDITDLYLSAYQNQQLYEMANSITDTIEIQLNLTHALMLKGLAKQTDFLLLKVELANQQIASAQAFNNYKTSFYELNTACGISDTTLIKLTPAQLNKTTYTDESAFLSQYSIDSMLVISQQNIFETKYLPQFSIFANAGLNAIELKGIQRKFGMSAGFNFSLPIYDGSQKSINRQMSEINANIIGIRKENQKLVIRNKRNEADSQIELYKKNIDAVQGQLKDYEQIIKLSKAELANGQLTMIEFITILRNLLDLKKTEIQAYTGYQQSVNQFNYWNW